MKRTLWIFMAIALVTTGSLAVIGCKGGDHAGHAGAAQKAKYHCPMHPTYVSDRQGDCPICGMRLVPIESQAEHEEAVEQTQQQGEERKPLYYRHPMQPNVTSPEPKKDEMGMDYVPVYPEEAKTEQPPDSFDRAAVSISSEKQQLIGVRTAPWPDERWENLSGPADGLPTIPISITP
ncbi:MAG: hypothetical protein IPN19_12345 [Elusimicrobia bacterium]|nr:hypothetical protein [Elusimicrobiota bacterium]